MFRSPDGADAGRARHLSAPLGGHPFREKNQMLKHSTFRTVALTAATGILAAGTVAGTALAATAAPAVVPASSVVNTPGDNDL
jgi:hypothetical protein